MKNMQMIGIFKMYHLVMRRHLILGFTPIIVDGNQVNSTDLVRQKWLDNDFYGTTFSVKYKEEKLDFIVGGGWNKYEGDHFGKIIWARYASQSELGDHYYDDFSTKTDEIFSQKQIIS